VNNALTLVRNRVIAFYEIALGKGEYTVQERNIGLLYLDVLVVATLSAAASFNSAFALRLGASNTVIGLMTSIPALITVVSSVPVSVVLERRSHRWPVMLRSLAITRALFLLVPLIPWVVAKEYQAVVFLSVLSVRFITLQPFAAGFDAVLADIVPPRMRAQVFSWRNVLRTGAVVVLLLLIRPWLGLVSFPLNYQVVYLLGGIGGMVSIAILRRVHVPEFKRVVPSQKRQGFSLSLVRAIVAENPDYVRFLVNCLIGDSGAYLASPLYIIYYVRHLGASDGWIGSANLAASLSAMVGYIVWRRLLPRLGESRTLRVTWPVSGLFPLFIALSGSLNLVILVILWYGLMAPGLNLSHYNTLLEVCPQAHRPTYISVYRSLSNLLAFVLPMVGVTLAGWLGIRTVLAAGSALWILGGIMFSIMRVRVADSSRAG